MEKEKVLKVIKKEIGHGEKEYLGGFASYKRVFDRFINDAVLCNNIVNVDAEIFFNQETGFTSYDEILEDYKKDYSKELEDGTITLEELEDKASEDEYNFEFYQYFIIDISNYNLEYLKESNQKTLQIMYSTILDCYILGVGHWGTGWDYVGSDFKLEVIEEV